eukprot:gnl/Dysnectes_brevis/1863_a2138_1643.p1 GENE.gnl/Dysnectes_brevis/1863_a2138_1643~~gnl/Dysnectes_brevis/1863_a2138_1643.p1  ORF type:complete len:325 (-),score=52.02 gnl/Dysnectes_brevis/1863_a2138_1643:597-1571(-)
MADTIEFKEIITKVGSLRFTSFHSTAADLTPEEAKERIKKEPQPKPIYTYTKQPRGGRSKPRPRLTHFVAIPFWERRDATGLLSSAPEFECVQDYDTWSSTLLSHSPALRSSLVDSRNLHITLMVLSLESQLEIDAVVALMTANHHVYRQLFYHHRLPWLRLSGVSSFPVLDSSREGGTGGKDPRSDTKAIAKNTPAVFTTPMAPEGRPDDAAGRASAVFSDLIDHMLRDMGTLDEVFPGFIERQKSLNRRSLNAHVSLLTRGRKRGSKLSLSMVPKEMRTFSSRVPRLRLSLCRMGPRPTYTEVYYSDPLYPAGKGMRSDEDE